MSRITRLRTVPLLWIFVFLLSPVKAQSAASLEGMDPKRLAECRELLKRALPYLAIAGALLGEGPAQTTSAPRTLSDIRSDLGLRRNLRVADHSASGLRAISLYRMTPQSLGEVEAGSLSPDGASILTLGRRAPEIAQQLSSIGANANATSPNPGPFPDNGTLSVASDSQRAVWAHGTLARLGLAERSVFIQETMRVLQRGGTARLVSRFPVTLPPDADPEMEEIIAAAVDLLLTRALGYSGFEAAVFVSRQEGATNILLTLTKIEGPAIPVGRAPDSPMPPVSPTPTSQDGEAAVSEDAPANESSWFWGLFGY